MSLISDFFVAPFADAQMRRALIGALVLAVGAGPIGVFLMLRRMSLMGDAMSHAILPGAAIGFLLFGSHHVAMSLGALIAGLAVALLAGLVARATELKEDASLAAVFLISLALGVALLAAQGSDEELVHTLFGNALALDNVGLMLTAAATTISLLVLALIWRPLVIECFDPGFLRSVSCSGGAVHIAFLTLVVLNLAAGFQALGALLAIGLMMLPAVTARFWTRDLTTMVLIAIGCGIAAAYGGLLLAVYSAVPPGPAIILVAGAFYAGSLVFGGSGGLLRRIVRRRHLEA
jgi:zinc/manganese transport system permease protein